MSQHPIAKVLRDHLVFKIAPMLNPDGVYLGNYRYGVEYESVYCCIYLIHPALFLSLNVLWLVSINSS